MINTGLHISLPCESGYSKLRRFYQVNVSQGLDNDQIIKELVKKNDSDISYSVYELKATYPVKIIRTLNQLLRNSIENSQFKYRDIDFKKTYRPVKHCSKCSSEGYHTYMFDYYWINECPLHGNELDFSCPKCKKPWPTNGQLKARICSTCGITKNKKVIYSSVRFKLKHYKPLMQLRRVLDQIRILKFPRILIHPFNDSFKHLEGFSNFKSDVYLSALIKIGYKVSLIKTLQNKFKIPKYCVDTKQFVLEPNEYDSENMFRYSLFDDKNQILEEFNNLIVSNIKTLLSKDHNIGDCINSIGACRLCSKVIQWMVITGYDCFAINSVEYHILKSKINKSQKYIPMKKFLERSSKEARKIDHSPYGVYFVSNKLRLFLYKLNLTYLVKVILQCRTRPETDRSGISSWNEIFEMAVNNGEKASHARSFIMVRQIKNQFTVIYDSQIILDKKPINPVN